MKSCRNMFRKVTAFLWMIPLIAVADPSTPDGVKLLVAILEVEFRFVESDQVQFGFDYTTDEKKDHLLRAVIDKGMVSARAGSGWGQMTRMKPFGPKPVRVEVPSGEWHNGRIEFYGQDVIIAINGKTVFASSAETPLAGVEKNRIALTARGVAQFRNLKLWGLEGLSAADWEKRMKSAQRSL